MGRRARTSGLNYWWWNRIDWGGQGIFSRGMCIKRMGKLREGQRLVPGCLWIGGRGKEMRSGTTDLELCGLSTELLEKRS